MSLSLDALMSFLAVAERGGFTAAARQRGVSKATISKHVAELERALGVSLFARTTRTLTLTEPGRRALERARRIQEEAEALVEEAVDTRASPRGRLKIAAPLAFGQRCLSPVLPDFLRAYPEISLEFSFDDRTVDLVADGFDAAIRIGSMPDSSLLARQIAPVRLHLVAAPAYWHERGHPARPEELAMHACIRYANSEAGTLWSFTGPAGAPDAREVRVRVAGPLCVNNGEVELATLRAGLGCAVLPDFMIAEDVRSGALATALPGWSAGERMLHLLTPPGRGRPRRLEAFSDHLVQRLGGRPPPWAL